MLKVSTLRERYLASEVYTHSFGGNCPMAFILVKEHWESEFAAYSYQSACKPHDLQASSFAATLVEKYKLKGKTIYHIKK
jgi:hypothetical protein